MNGLNGLIKGYVSIHTGVSGKHRLRHHRESRTKLPVLSKQVLIARTLFLSLGATRLTKWSILACLLLCSVVVNTLPADSQCNTNVASSPITSSDETSDIPGSRQLVDGAGTTINTSTPGQIKVDIGTGTVPVAGGGTGATTAAGARSNLGAAESGANSDITSLTGLTTPLSLPQGGTGATTASGARSNLSAAESGANSDITSLSGLSTPLSLTQGGTGAATASGARSNLSAAASGANSDITSLSALSTPLSLSQGGTGATTASGARSNLSAAASGANSDITSLSALSTPLSLSQGGTGATTASGARSNLSAAVSGANSDITSLSGLSTPLSVPQGGTGASSLTNHGVLVGAGSSAISATSAGTAGQVLTSNGSGSDPTFQTISALTSLKFTVIAKSGNFSATDGAGSYYRVSATATVTLPASPADGSVYKFKVTGGTSTFAFNGAETINHANGVSDQSLSLTSSSGVLELTAVSGGWDET